MKSEDAIKLVESQFAEAAAEYFKCDKAYIPDELTDEYEWGWVFWIIPFESELEELPRIKVAFHKVTKKMVQVGPKGVELALDMISS